MRDLTLDDATEDESSSILLRLLYSVAMNKGSRLFLSLSFCSCWIIWTRNVSKWTSNKQRWKGKSEKYQVRLFWVNCKKEMDKMSQVVVVFGGVISGKGHWWHSRPDWSFWLMILRADLGELFSFLSFSRNLWSVIIKIVPVLLLIKNDFL